MVTGLLGGGDTTPSTIALPEVPKFVAVCGDQPWTEGCRLLKLVLVVVSIATVGSFFGSKKLDDVSPSTPFNAAPWSSVAHPG